EQNDLWLLTRHADVIHALHEPRIFSSAGGYSEFMSGRVGPGDASGRANALRFDDLMGSRVMIASDPPDHTLLRRVVSRPFTKRRIAEWERMAQDLAADLLDEAEERLRSGESIDFTKDIAIPLPVTLIAGILGIPAERMADFRRWSEALVGALAASVDLERVGADLLEMSQFFSEVVGARRQDPGDDLISAIAAATPDGEQLSQIEVVLFSILLLVAGNETTTNLLGNLQHALWDHPSEWATVRSHPEQAVDAVEEGLRYCGPVQGLFRQVTEADRLGDVVLPAKAVVYVSFAAANRDESVFEAADSFKLNRDSREHVALGHGVHYCLGAQLARLETRVVLEELARRDLDLVPHGAPTAMGNAVLRGYSSIPVALA
ncbi:MAG: cytochrome P450, partial [Dehalococcoidia bacterium]|nr:cytochrome P450 [Dehalococcoidia bacterium]